MAAARSVLHLAQTAWKIVGPIVIEIIMRVVWDLTRGFPTEEPATA
jgi:hypothetical protein